PRLPAVLLAPALAAAESLANPEAKLAAIAALVPHAATRMGEAALSACVADLEVAADDAFVDGVRTLAPVLDAKHAARLMRRAPRLKQPVQRWRAYAALVPRLEGDRRAEAIAAGCALAEEAGEERALAYATLGPVFDPAYVQRALDAALPTRGA